MLSNPDASYSTELLVRVTGQEATEQIQVSLTGTEVQALTAYLEDVEEFWKLPIVQQGLPTKLRLQIVEGKLKERIASLPDVSDLAACLHKIRPLILSSEPASFEKVLGIIGKNVNSKCIRGILKRERARFLGARFRSMLRVEITTVDPESKPDSPRPCSIALNSEEAFKDWINAFEYHRDPERKARIEALTYFLTFDEARVIFLLHLGEKIDAIGNVACLVAVLLGRQKAFEILPES